MKAHSSSSTSSSERRTARDCLRLLGAGASALALVAGVWLSLNLLRRDVRIENGTARHICDFLALKRAIAAEVPGDRIVFFGLSNVMMGMRSQEIGDALGVHALNFGLVGNLSSGMALEALDAVSGGGDLVVLSVPYWFFQLETTLARQERIVKDLVFSCPTSGYFRLPIGYQIKFLLQQDCAQVSEALARKGLRSIGLASWWSEPEVLGHLRRERDGGVFTPSGDWTGNDLARRTPAMLERVEARANRLDGYRVELDGESVASLVAFVRAARVRGTRIVAVWPPVYVGGSREESARARVIDEIRALYAKLGVETLGEPGEFFYPIEAFFDSPNHLTREMATEYSARVAELLEPVVRARWPARDVAHR